MIVSQIYEGWKNKMFPAKEMKEWIEQTSAYRMAICKECPHNSIHTNSLRPDEHCTKCGCTLSAKTRCLSCQCPLEAPLWKPVLESQDEEHELKKMIQYAQPK